MELVELPAQRPGPGAGGAADAPRCRPGAGAQRGGGRSRPQAHAARRRRFSSTRGSPALARVSVSRSGVSVCVVQLARSSRSSTARVWARALLGRRRTPALFCDAQRQGELPRESFLPRNQRAAQLNARRDGNRLPLYYTALINQCHCKRLCCFCYTSSYRNR